MEVKEIANRLTLRHAPLRKIAGRTMILIGTLTLLFLLSTIFTSASLNCQRISQNQISCELKRATKLGQVTTVNLPSLLGAGLEVYQKGPRYEVILLTSKGEVSLLAHSGGDDQSSQLAVFEINQFVHHSNRSALAIQYDGQNYLSMPKFFAVFFIAVGLFASIAFTTVCIFDRDIAQVSLTQRFLCFRKIRSYALADILNVQPEWIDIENRDGWRTKLYRVVLILQNGEHIFLVKDYCLSKFDAYYVARTVLAFLGKEQ